MFPLTHPNSIYIPILVFVGGFFFKMEKYMKELENNQ